MRFGPTLIAGAAGLLSHAAMAEGYNTLVIEVPYEISVPASLESAFLLCQTAFHPGGGVLRASRTIELVNGQATGSLKFGWDLNGSAPDLDKTAPETARFSSGSPDFNAQVFCEIGSFSGTNLVAGGGQIKGSRGSYYFGDEREIVLLDADTDPSKLDVTLTHADNRMGRDAPTASATVAPAQVPRGLQGLQSILDGQ